MKLFNNTRREYFLIGILVGIVLTVAAHEVPKYISAIIG